MLIAYLPTESVSRRGLKKREVGSRHQRLFHESMRIILEPLNAAGQEGVEMCGGDGAVRLVFPILCCYVADFPEQCLVTCSKYGTCPKCRISAKDLDGSPPMAENRTQAWTLGVMQDGKNSSETTNDFYKHCMSLEVSGSVYVPFWKGFPHCDIHRAITPDVLHQLYQGVFKHIVTWCQTLLSAEELDARLRTLPHAFGVRHFSNGFSALSQISGPERKQMAKVLLGCLVGKVAKKGLRAVKAILDFIYLSQYDSHNAATLQYMVEALDQFDANKNFFIETGIRSDLKIPKFHSLHHFIESIKLFGTTDNYNTEMFECLHIDFTKEGWRASNQRDVFPQMVTWLSRQEKISSFDNYLDFVDKKLNPIPSSVTSSNSKNLPISIAKFPTFPNKLISSVEATHHSPRFSQHLKEYLNSLLNHPTSTRRSNSYALPFTRLDIFSQFKFHPVSLDDTDQTEENDTVKAIPSTTAKPHGRFDTVIILKGDRAESTGMEGLESLESLPFEHTYICVRNQSWTCSCHI